MNHDPPFANSGVYKYNFFFGGSTTTVRGLGNCNFGTTKAGARNKMDPSPVLGAT